MQLSHNCWQNKEGKSERRNQSQATCHGFNTEWVFLSSGQFRKNLHKQHGTFTQLNWIEAFVVFAFQYLLAAGNASSHYKDFYRAWQFTKKELQLDASDPQLNC